MIKHLSMKPTGWFQVGWSEEIPPGGVKPLKYFGHELVAFRTLAGELAILDAHCPHMGAHLGHGGKVQGDCIACPYHGWQFDTSGANAKIPYEDYTANKKLRRWHVIEKHECVFLWHDPAGGPPRDGWLADLFDHDVVPADPADFYPAYRNGAIVYKPGEKIHPQLINENGADSAHFKYTHGAPMDPIILGFEGGGPVWKSSFGFRSAKTGQVALTHYARGSGVGLSFTVFHHHGSGKDKSLNNRLDNYGFNRRGFNRRLILSATPVDDERTDLRVTYFFPRDHRSPEVMPQYVLDVAADTERLFEEDARIWRHQKFIQRPLFAKSDVEIYTALRKWSDQFYEVAGLPVGPMTVVEES